MSESVEALLEEAGIEFENPIVVQAANAIWDGSLSSLSLELDEHGDLLINSDELVETVDISEGEDNEEEFFDEEKIQVKEEEEEFDEEKIQVREEEEEYDDGEGDDAVQEGGVGEHYEGQEGGEGDNDVQDGEVIGSNYRRCGVCGEVKHKKSILRHIKLVHENQKVICVECGIQLNSEAKLLAHTAKVHGENEEEEVECSFCKKKFAGRAKAAYHETTVHKGEVDNQFKCSVCDKTYKTQPNLSRHKRDKHRD